MSLLTVCQSAAIRLNFGRPIAIVSSSRVEVVEMLDLAKEEAEDVASRKDWRALTRQCQMTGDGATEGFTLPADYDRMVTGENVTNPAWTQWSYQPAATLDEFQYLRDGQPGPTPGTWIILEGEMKFQPVLGSSDVAQFFYVTKNVVLDGDTQEPKETFTKDGDTFRLDERLLMLGIVWRHKKMKGRDYAEDFASYEQRLEEVSGTDSAPRIIVEGRRYFGHVGVAYPYGRLGP